VYAPRSGSWETFTGYQVWNKICQVIIVCYYTPDLLYASMYSDFGKDALPWMVIHLKNAHTLGARVHSSCTEGSMFLRQGWQGAKSLLPCYERQMLNAANDK